MQVISDEKPCLNKGGNGIRSPPDLKFELKIKFQIQEDKTVKYAPKKVFILENGKYKEITYVYKRLETEIFGDENNE